MADTVFLQPRGSREPSQTTPDFQLVGSEYVEACLAKAHGAVVLLEAHFTSADHPAASVGSDSLHIPGAIQAHPSYLEAGTNRSKYYPYYENPADGNLLADQELAEAIQRLGIAPDTLVVVYGTEPDGAMAAARLVWALLYAGVDKVRLLDGGLDSWLTYGGDLTAAIRSAADVARPNGHPAESKSRWRSRAELLATTAEVYKISTCPTPTASKLVDVRRPGEWDGTQTDHYPFFSKAGHIPSAEYQGDWNNLVDMDTHQLGPMLDAVAQRWRDQGIIDADVEAGNTTLIFYCGTGWRSSIAVVVALLLGLRAKNYDDGFYGWSWNEENEIAIGDTGLI